MSDTNETSETPEPAPTWTQRVGKTLDTLDTVERFTADEVKAIAADALNEELNRLPLRPFRAAPEPASFAERVTPQKRLEQILAKVSVECIKRFLGQEQEPELER